MKKYITKIFTREESDLLDTYLYYDEEYVPGLRLASQEHGIDTNISKLQIEPVLPKSKHDLGIRFSFNYEFVAITIIHKLQGKQEKIQFFVDKTVKPETILNINHYFYNTFKDIIIRAIAMGTIKTVADIDKFGKFCEENEL